MFSSLNSPNTALSDTTKLTCRKIGSRCEIPTQWECVSDRGMSGQGDPDAGILVNQILTRDRKRMRDRVDNLLLLVQEPSELVISEEEAFNIASTDPDPVNLYSVNVGIWIGDTRDKTGTWFRHNEHISRIDIGMGRYGRKHPLTIIVASNVPASDELDTSTNINIKLKGKWNIEKIFNLNKKIFLVMNKEDGLSHLYTINGGGLFRISNTGIKHLNGGIREVIQFKSPITGVVESVKALIHMVLIGGRFLQQGIILEGESIGTAVTIERIFDVEKDNFVLTGHLVDQRQFQLPLGIPLKI